MNDYTMRFYTQTEYEQVVADLENAGFCRSIKFDFMEVWYKGDECVIIELWWKM